MTKARDISKLLSTANGKIAGENLDVSFENITDTGTTGTRVATGTTAQRGSTAGQIRFNTTTGLAEYYTGSEFKVLDTPPAIVSVDVTNIETDLGGIQTFVITGTLFNAGATVKFRDNGGTEITADTTTVNSSSQITATKTRSSFSNANEPYDVIVTNTSGLSATLDDYINVDNSPTWSTASGSLGSVNKNSSASFSVSATDPDGDTVSYSETGGTVLSTNGLSINSSTGAITGTAPTVASETTLSFTLRATANSKTADRSFSIIITNFKDGATSGDAFTSLSQGATYISNSSSPSGLYFMNVGTGTSYGQSQIQFYFYNAGADGVYVGIPLGTSTLGSIGGSFLPSTLTNYKTLGQHTNSGVSAGTQGNFNGSNQFDTTSSTNAGGNNNVDNYANFDLGTEFNYRYFYGTDLTATGSGGSTADWSNITAEDGTVYSNDAPTNQTFFWPSGFSDSVWLGLNTGSTSGILTRPTAWSIDVNGANQNITATGDIASSASPKDLGASAIGRYFGLHVFGGTAEHYVINSGIMYFKA